MPSNGQRNMEKYTLKKKLTDASFADKIFGIFDVINIYYRFDSFPGNFSIDSFNFNVLVELVQHASFQKGK